MATTPHVLLLNASPDESDMYALWLQWCGYRVTVALNRAAARRIVRRAAVDVLVIDAVFGASPSRDAFDGQWKGPTTGVAPAIVVLSGYLTDAAGRTPHGARRVCVFKPCLPQQLSGCIGDLLSTSPHALTAGDKGQPVAGCAPS